MFKYFATVALIGFAVGFSMAATPAKEGIQESLEQRNSTVQQIQNFNSMIESGQL